MSWWHDRTWSRLMRGPLRCNKIRYSALSFLKIYFVIHLWRDFCGLSESYPSNSLTEAMCTILTSSSFRDFFTSCVASCLVHWYYNHVVAVDHAILYARGSYVRGWMSWRKGIKNRTGVNVTTWLFSTFFLFTYKMKVRRGPCKEKGKLLSLTLGGD